jgi:hypothetical protein
MFVCLSSYVAVYGQSYCDAGSSVWQLLCSKGFDAIINEDLTSSVLALGSFIGACVTGAFGYYLTKYEMVG